MIIRNLRSQNQAIILRFHNLTRNLKLSYSNHTSNPSTLALHRTLIKGLEDIMIYTKELIKKNSGKNNKRVCMYKDRSNNLILMNKTTTSRLKILIIRNQFLKNLNREVANKMSIMMKSITMMKNTIRNIINRERRKRRKDLEKFLMI